MSAQTIINDNVIILRQRNSIVWERATVVPICNIPILVRLEKNELNLAFYVENRMKSIDDDEIYTEYVDGKYYLKRGWYYLNTNVPILYPIAEWSYFL